MGSQALSSLLSDPHSSRDAAPRISGASELEGKNGKYTNDEDDTQDIDSITDPDRIVAGYMRSAVRGIGLPIWNEQLTRLHDKYISQSQPFADNVKALYKCFNDRE